MGYKLRNNNNEKLHTGMSGEWFSQFGKEMGKTFLVKLGWEGKGKGILVLFLSK